MGIARLIAELCQAKVNALLARVAALSEQIRVGVAAVSWLAGSPNGWARWLGTPRSRKNSPRARKRPDEGIWR